MCENSSCHKLDIDAVNENGDTALHIASRWGFSMSLLLCYCLINLHGLRVRPCALSLSLDIYIWLYAKP